MGTRNTVLVAGGAGFIGSHLCDRLIQQGHEVICLDSFETGVLENVQPLNNHPRFHLLCHDVVKPLTIERRIDHIYNLACPASPPHYQRDPVRTMRTSVLGAMNLLELARRHGARILQASTSEIYGDPDCHPQPEEYCGNVNPIGPRACYDEGKRSAETLFYDYHRRYRVSVKVARIFNTYGPRMRSDDGRIVSNFIVQALTGKPITIYGDGSQTRSFCYVEDMVDALQRLMLSRPDVTGPVNLGNPEEVPVIEFARRIRAMTGTRSEISFLPLPVDDPKRRRPLVARAAALLDWRPTTPLAEGLRRTVEYFGLRLTDAQGRQTAFGHVAVGPFKSVSVPAVQSGRG